MDLARAVEVLNERRHRGQSDWHIWGPIAGQPPLACTNLGHEYFELQGFEAIAIAERYERDGA